MIKKLNFSGALMLLVLLTIFVFSSCRKEKLNVEENTQIEELQTTTDLEFFLSREKTYNLLASTAFNWKKPENQISDRNDEITELQDIIVDINEHLNEKYVNRLIDKVGYPLWDASTLELLEDGGYTLFTPVFKVDSDKINGLFSYTNTVDGKKAYSVTTREKLTASSSSLKDPNFVTKVTLFEHYDGLLFNYHPSIYDDWKVLVVDDVTGCFETTRYSEGINGIIIGNLDFGSCSFGCYDDLWNSSVLNTPEEISWARGECEYSSVVNEFLEDSDLEYKNELAEIFVIIGMSDMFDLVESFQSIITVLEQDLTEEDVIWLLNNPILLLNMTEDVEEQTNFGFTFNESNINRFCNSLFNLQPGIIPADPNDPNSQPQPYFESGVSGFNLSWVRSSDQRIFSHSTNYLYLYIEQQCNDQMTPYDEILASAVRNSFGTMQTLVNNGTITDNNIGFALGAQIKVNLAILYDECSDNNFDTAKAQTLALLKENVAGVGSNLNSYQEINPLTINDLCP